MLEGKSALSLKIDHRERKVLLIELMFDLNLSNLDLSNWPMLYF